MDLISKQAVLVNDPQFLKQVLDFIANGGELAEFCLLHDLSFSATLTFLRQTVERRDLYERALDDKDQWTINKVRKDLRDLASANLADMFDSDGKLLPIQSFPDSLKRAITGIKISKDGSAEIKFVDKTKLLEMLGRSAGMFKDKVEHSGKVTLESLVDASMKRDKDE